METLIAPPVVTLSDRAAFGPNEVAKLLGLDPKTVARAIADGEIRTGRVRKRVLISAEEVRRLIGLGEVKPATERPAVIA